MIKDKTNDKIIIMKERFCTSFICKGTGLMFRRKPDYGLVFVFEKSRKVALTMMFVFYPIDVIFLDERMRLVEMKKDFMPFSSYFPMRAAKYVIELPCGCLEGVKIGDIIEVPGLGVLH